MADPRLDVKFDDIKAVFATYKIDNVSILFSSVEDRGAVAAMIDHAVSLSADSTVQLIGDGEGVEGKLIEVFDDNFASVQVGGYMTLPGGSGATLTLGAAIVGDLGAASAEGFIRVSDGSTAAEIQKQRGGIVDASTATAVVVRVL